MNHNFTILEHPSDIGIEANGKTLIEAFEQSALGMMSIIAELSSVDVKDSRNIEIHSVDVQQLLVKWLSEILYLYDGQRFLAKDFQVQILTSSHLAATVHGEYIDSTRHKLKMDIKAVTYHQLYIHEGIEGSKIKVFFDI